MVPDWSSKRRVQTTQQRHTVASTVCIRFGCGLLERFIIYVYCLSYMPTKDVSLPQVYACSRRRHCVQRPPSSFPGSRFYSGRQGVQSQPGGLWLRQFQRRRQNCGYQTNHSVTHVRQQFTNGADATSTAAGGSCRRDRRTRGLC